MTKRRMLIFGTALILTVMLFQNYFLAPRSENMRSEIAAKYGTLQKYEAYLKGAAITEAETKRAAEDIGKLNKRLIAEKSEFLSSAAMQRLVSDLSERSGLNVLSLRPMNTSKEGAFIIVPVYFEGTGSIKQISEFFRNAEANPLLLKIDKINLNVTNMQNPKDLRFKIQVSGLGRA